MKLPVLQLEFDGIPYTIDFSDIDALEWLALRQKTGMGDLTAKVAFERIDEGDLPTLAGLLWVVRRRTEKNLTFEKVAQGVKFAHFPEPDDIDDEPADGEDEEDDGDDIPPTSSGDGDG